MFPLKDNVGTRTTPIVTIALIVTNVIVYFLSIRHGGSILSGPDSTTVVHYGAIPYEFTHPGKECDLVSQAGRAARPDRRRPPSPSDRSAAPDPSGRR